MHVTSAMILSHMRDDEISLNANSFASSSRFRLFNYNIYYLR